MAKVPVRVCARLAVPFLLVALYSRNFRLLVARRPAGEASPMAPFGIFISKGAERSEPKDPALTSSIHLT